MRIWNVPNMLTPTPAPLAPPPAPLAAGAARARAAGALLGAFFGLALVLRFALRLRPLAGAPSPGFARVALSVARSSAHVSGSSRGSPPPL